MSGSPDIDKWLAEYQQLVPSGAAASALTASASTSDVANPQAAVNRFALKSRASQSLYSALETCLESCTNCSVVAPVCNQLFQMFKHDDIDMRRFTLELLPSIVLTYLRAVHHRKCILHASLLCDIATGANGAGESAPIDESETTGGAWMQWLDLLETLVLGLYNVAALRQPSGGPFLLPSLAHPSLYHQGLAIPGHTPSLILQPQCRPVKSVNNENRFSLLTQLLAAYTDQVDSLSYRSQQSFLHMLCRVCDHSRRLVPPPRSEQWRARIVLDQSFLLQSLQALYRILFASQGVPLPRRVRGMDRMEQLALEALLVARSRASYDLFTDALLVANSVLNSLSTHPASNATDSTSVAAGGAAASLVVTPQRPLDPSVTKNVVTNASFRTRRLPEDIPIAYSTRIAEEDGASDEDSLTAASTATPPKSGGRSRSRSKSERPTSFTGGLEQDIKDATQSIKKNLSSITKSLHMAKHGGKASGSGGGGGGSASSSSPAAGRANGAAAADAASGSPTASGHQQVPHVAIVHPSDSMNDGISYSTEL
ncbi:hypothetical protein BOX15_Mlig002259g1 [Macrostomum lignano]|uniref:Uncharacterized protein n=2 Tax=Macrostomum lignano TaxID=282301 RepID=A0A267GMN1_9PLAT|nr:hypothetical protein BOX15_Mlig002259g1 [Macrostomum lignano]